MDPFVTGDLPPGALAGGWRHGNALAVRRMPPMNRPPSMVLFGPVDDLTSLVARLLTAGEFGRVRGVTIERHAFVLVAAQLNAAGLVLGDGGDWDWMWTSHPPAAQRRERDVVELDEIGDVRAIRALYSIANPLAESQPGEGISQVWLGVRDGPHLAAVGALQLTHAGYPHLTGIAVAPTARGEGLGIALSAALTRRALQMSSMSTLGMYADNNVARAIYTRLGYRAAREWSSRPFASGRGAQTL